MPAIRTMSYYVVFQSQAHCLRNIVPPWPYAQTNARANHRVVNNSDADALVADRFMYDESCDTAAALPSACPVSVMHLFPPELRYRNALWRNRAPWKAPRDSGSYMYCTGLHGGPQQAGKPKAFVDNSGKPVDAVMITPV